MWPGSDLPVGPPPASPPPHREPPRIRPRGGWYAIPAVLLVGAMITVVLSFALYWDETEVADGPQARGNAGAGLEVQLTADHNYLIHVRSGDSPPTSCVLSPEGRPDVPVQLRRPNSLDTTPPPGFTYGSAFIAPISGTAELTCRGLDGTVVVVPDDTVYGFLALWWFIAMGLGGVGVIAFIVILVMRVNSAKRRRAAMAAPPGPYHPYGY